MKQIRTVQIFKDMKWQDISFNDLKSGDKFRMFEPDGDPVINTIDGTTEWVAGSDVYYEDGNYQIKIKE